MLESYLKLRGKHEGENAFVVGAGTSLYRELDPSLQLDKEIHNHVVVTVNSSFIIMPWDTGDPNKRYWVSNDSLCRWWDYWPRLKESKCNRIVRDSWEKYYAEIPDFLYFSPRPTPEDTINPEDEGLCYCSSVPTAVDLCLQMGCKRIFLLGVDHYMSRNKSHFWQFMNINNQPKRSDGGMAMMREQRNVFRYNDMAYAALRGFADHLGADLYNCNPESKAIDVFNMITFKEALEIVKNK